MKSRMSYIDKIRWRIRVLWLVFVAMLGYMVVVGETGGGDSRIMTDLAERVSRLLFFGGMAYVIYRIVYNKKLLKDRMLRLLQRELEQDERNQYLHDKSGGTVMDILLIALLFITETSALYNMDAFHVSLAILVLAVLLKGGAYLIVSRS